MPKPAQEGPNPLFTRWLEEWRDQAAENGRLKSQRAYERVSPSHRGKPLPPRQAPPPMNFLFWDRIPIKAAE